jgi:23S rRNA (uracil1939-C5)-methyltransferase
LLLTIEKLIYGGDGLAHLPPDLHNDTHNKNHSRGKAVFIPFVLPEEQVESTLTEQKPGFARARLDAVIQPSPHRIVPACPYFSRCGGCHYQHTDYEQQLEIKKQILRENLKRIARLDLQSEIEAHPSPPWNYRNRSRLQLRTRPDFAAGYFRFASHELLPVEECPISSALINRGIAALWQSGRAGKAAEGVQEVSFFANAEDTHLLLEFSCGREAKPQAIEAWAADLRASRPEITGISVFREGRNETRESLGTVGAPELTYQTRTASFRVSSGSFFQTNRFLIGELVDIVTRSRKGELALDLYAGVGLFSTALACNFRHVISVESSQTATKDLKYNLPTNGKAVRSATGQYLTEVAATARAGADGSSAKSHGERSKGRVGKGKLPQNYLHTPDLIVVDPPRSGLGDRVARALAEAYAPRITYVSCDPATLARDLVPLQAAGYRIEEVHLVDLFPQTYHLESVIHLAR